jgi:hypothetical protein
MKQKILVVMMIVILSMGILTVFSFAKKDVTLTLPDSELSTQFGPCFGPGTIAAITDIAGPGVRFDFTGLTSSGTGVSDNYAVSQLAGGDLDSIGGFGNFRRYTQYRLIFTNVGTTAVSVNLLMNTGWTNPDASRNTYWENGWVYVEPSKSRVVTLDFSSATVYSASDDPEFPQYADGTSGVAIWRLNEVSNIGFQVTGAGAASIVVSATTPSLTLTLEDNEMVTQFAKENGPGTLTGPTDIAGPGVQFDFTGLSTSSGTTVGDTYPVSQLAGGALDGIGGYGDFGIYSRYSMMFTNPGTDPITVCLKMNTGWTIPDARRDTYWQSPWTAVGAKSTVTVTLEFNNAIVYGAGDDPDFTHYADGTVGVAIWRLNEVSDVGFQILGNGAASVVVTRLVDVPLSLSDAELGTQFAKEVGPGTVSGITNMTGSGVRFDLTGLDPSTGTIVGDNFPVSPLANGAWKDYGNGFAGPYDFSPYTCYKLAFTNVGTNSVSIALAMNTGWTAAPWGTPQRDTFWQGDWTTIAPGETKIVKLDFWSANAVNAADDPNSAWQYPDWTSNVIVRRLDEVSNIEFNVEGNGAGSVVVRSFFDVCLTFTDPELNANFAAETGPGTVTSITDITGPGVQFNFTGLSSTGTVVGDNFPVHQLAGGSYKTYGVTNQFSTYGDFSAYTKLKVYFTNVGTTTVKVNLKLNTGWTTPPPEYAAAWRDTYWQASWTTLAAGESKIVTLDFCSAEVYNAADEKDFTPYADGSTGVPIWRLDEVSDIGFQVQGSGGASIIVSGAQVVLGTHNVAVTQITPSKTAAFPGDIIDVNVTAANLGNFTESFNVTLFYNSTQIGKIAVNTLGPGHQLVLAFHWNTLGLAVGSYNLTAVADTVSGETNTTDNTLPYPQLIKLMPPITLLMKVDPSAIHAKTLNQTFQVNITLNNVTPDMHLVGFEFTLQYNATLLEITGMTNGSFLQGFAGPPNGGTLYYGPFFGPDYVLYGGMILPDGSGNRHPPYPSGNGTIATITFRAKYQPMGIPQPNATCNLILNDTKLADATPNPILHNTMDGFYEIVPTPLGDLNFDGTVDIYDALIFAQSYGTTPTDSHWNPYADLNHDHIIDIYDAILVGKHFGEQRPDP